MPTHLLISDLRKLISERSNLKPPLAPWEVILSKDYFQEEKHRTLTCLENLRAQERLHQVSTELVLQVIVGAWGLRSRLQASRDRDLKPLWKTFEDISINYGFTELWREKFYSRMLEALLRTITRR